LKERFTTMIYTVAEVSDLVNLTKASIYNRIKLKEFEKHITKKQGVTCIDDIALKLIQNGLKDYKDDLNNTSVDEEVATDTDYICSLKEDIKYLKTENEKLWEQLQEKDRQLNTKDRLLENSQVLLKEKPKQDILLLEEHFQDLDSKLEEVKENMQQRKEHQKSKGFFNKIFGGTDKS